MKPIVKITKSVLDRIKVAPENCQGGLYGIIHDNCQYIIGLYLDTTENDGDLHFPSDVDLCGFFQIGEFNKESINELIKQVDVTDNPVILSAPELSIVLAYHVINDQFVPATISTITDADIHREFKHVHVKAKIPFTSALEAEAIKGELLEIRKQFSSGKIAFHLQKHDIFLLGSNENVCGKTGFKSDVSLNSLNQQSSQISEINYSRNDAPEMDVLPVVIYRKATLENETETIHAPLIQMEKCNAITIQMLLNVDCLAMVHKTTNLSTLYSILVECACRNIRLQGQFMVDYLQTMEDSVINRFHPEVLHFHPPQCSHFISRVMNKYDKDEDEHEVKLRQNLHSNFLLPKNRPIFRSVNKHLFNTNVLKKVNSRLVNPHLTVRPSGNEGDETLVSGNYEYYHYCQDGMDDDGWGCAYRSLQTLASWFNLQGYTNKDVPSYKEIQKCLYDIGDKPASFVGSKQWIGSTEVSFVLESLLGISSRIMYVSSGEEMSTKGPELEYHFKTQGTPVMIGGGVLAHTILGVDYNKMSGELKFLILDPHYKGSEDLKTVITKGWCGWKGCNFWDKKAYYNMCLPMVPNGV